MPKWKKNNCMDTSSDKDFTREDLDKANKGKLEERN